MFDTLKRSIRRKFLAATIGTCAVALLVTGSALLVYDLRAYRESSTDQLNALAGVLGLAARPALAFNDASSAERLLQSLRAHPQVTAGIVFDTRGRTFARYVAEGSQADPPLEVGPPGYAVGSGRIAVVLSVVQEREALGRVYLEAQYDVASRVLRYIGVLAGVMLASLLLSYVLSIWLRRTLTDPIITLSEVTRRVVHDRDFAQRVRKTSDDELGDLVESFNAMMAEIGRRARALEDSNAALEHANRALEFEVAERTAAEQALRETDQRKDEFIAVLSHELRNPLSPILNATALLAARPSDDPIVVKAREIIERQSRHLARLIDDLMDASRISRNKLELRLETVALSGIVETAVEAVRDLVQARQQHLELSLPRVPVLLRADSARLAQVLGNLLNNASKYTDPRGHIRLEAQLDGPQVLISVSDDGIGIPAEAAASLFQMFSQVSAHRARSAGGLGIGLALVKGLVEMHGGSVEVRSDGPGRGSTFLVRFPLAEAEHELRRPGASQLPAMPCLRVLVADDVPDSVDSLSQLLQQFGHEVHVARSGAEAIERAREIRPEVAILDIGMPGITGYEVAEQLRREAWGRDITLIALTGWGQREDRRATRQAGFDFHMTKPTDVERLYGLLALAAERRKSSEVHP